VTAFVAAVDVDMDVDASAEEVAAVKAAFSDAGVEATIDAGLETRSVDLAPWVISFSVSLTIFLRSFLEAAGKAAGEAAGKDAYAAFKRLAAALYEARRPAGRRGSVVIMDTVTHQRVLLADDLPDLAFQRLFETDFAPPTPAQSGTMRWDSKTESWRDVWDMDRLS